VLVGLQRRRPLQPTNRAGPAVQAARPAPGELASQEASDERATPSRQPDFERVAVSAPPPAGGVGGDNDDGRPLESEARGVMERAFGADFSHVRVHDGRDASAIARALGARAFTLGNHIAFAADQYQPRGAKGKRLLAHELAHVVQQRGGVGTPQREVGTVKDPAEREADRAAQAAVSGVRMPPLSRVPMAVQRQDAQQIIEVELVGHVSEHRLGSETHRVGENAGANILMDIELGVGGAVTYRWFAFEAGVPVTGTAQDWAFRYASAVAFAPNPAFARLGRQLSADEWRRLWPNPVPELLRRFEAGSLSIDDPAILTAYRGLVRSAAHAQLDENERQIDALLDAPNRLARLQEYAVGLREASQIRDQLEARRADIEHSLVQQHSFTFGVAGNIINLDPAARMRRTAELGTVNDVIAAWYGAFPLLSRFRTAEINGASVESTLRTIKANIVATRPRLRPNGELDPMDLENTRARVAPTLGPRATGVVQAEDRSRSRWAVVGAVATLAATIAILFLPGGIFIDAAIGIAMAGSAWQEAAVIGRAANTGLSVDDGLMSQAQADSARWHAILATIFAVVGAAAAGFRVLRGAHALLSIRTTLPELELAQQVRLARALADNPSLLRTLTGPAAQGDAFVLSRVRAAVRDLGGDPAALRRSLEVTGTLARIPRRIVDNDAYAPIRAITDGSDIEAVARVTGFTRGEVAAAKQHFMIDEHVLVDNAGQAFRSRFVADARDGRIWLNAAQGRHLPAEEVTHLRRLVRHELVEGRVLANQLRTLEQAYVRHELEGLLRQFLSRHLPPDRVRALLASETRPIMPARYAHYVAHFSGGPNP
jgi:hypothetical protein